MYNELQSRVDKATPSVVQPLINNMKYYMFTHAITGGEYRTLCKRLGSRLLTPGTRVYYLGQDIQVKKCKGLYIHTTDGAVYNIIDVLSQGRFM